VTEKFNLPNIHNKKLNNIDTKETLVEVVQAQLTLLKLIEKLGGVN